MASTAPDCLRCRVPMVRGFFSVERTGAGYAPPGLDAPLLVFHDSFGNRVIALEWSGGRPDVYLCELCSACLIQPA